MDLNAEYNNRAMVPEHPAIVEGWARDAAHFRTSAGGELGIAYGRHPRQQLDYFHTREDRGGVICLFVHGGYWQGLDRTSFSHMAQGLAVHGVPVAVPSYRLCPEVGVKDIIADIRKACLLLWEQHRRHLVVAGHSAGGHLAAAMAATDWQRHGGPAGLVTAGFGISGLYDLRPLIATYVNDALKLDNAAALAASPLSWPAPQDVRFEAWVGGDESSEYLRQTQTLTACWLGCGVDCRAVVSPGDNHFTVVRHLAQPDSAMTLALNDLCGAA